VFFDTECIIKILGINRISGPRCQIPQIGPSRKLSINRLSNITRPLFRFIDYGWWQCIVQIEFLEKILSPVLDLPF
jgi:hypothetical protein